ncbi:hypothetical protein H5410_023089 [Solanum commersonii]|uniref:Uncharacterized protein n=1 Tax=Solanum commersonii TaxID=4109 RepID=A0A9J5ZIS0_SOLCO|nr:hypothetical protein H5410_023089 [Solanum commersonii]
MKEQATTTLVQEEVHAVVIRRGQELWDKSSAHMTCNIGFKLTKGLKWKDKHAMTQRELKVQSVMRRIQTKSKAVGIQTRA